MYYKILIIKYTNKLFTVKVGTDSMSKRQYEFYTYRPTSLFPQMSAYVPGKTSPYKNRW